MWETSRRDLLAAAIAAAPADLWWTELQAIRGSCDPTAASPLSPAFLR